MLYMVIEQFQDKDMGPTYKRLQERGRGLPDGLVYIDSWVEASFARCFQLMRCDDVQLFEEWVLHWDGCGVTFEIIPVVSGAEAGERVRGKPGEPIEERSAG